MGGWTCRKENCQPTSTWKMERRKPGVVERYRISIYGRRVGSQTSTSVTRASTCEVGLEARRTARTRRVLSMRTREAKHAAGYRKLVGNRVAEPAAAVRITA